MTFDATRRLDHQMAGIGKFSAAKYLVVSRLVVTDTTAAGRRQYGVNREQPLWN
jgi:hypothetical protein